MTSSMRHATNTTRRTWINATIVIMMAALMPILSSGATIPSIATALYTAPYSAEYADVAVTGIRVTGGPRVSDNSAPSELTGTVVASIMPHGGAAMIVPEPYPDPNGPSEAFDIPLQFVMPHSLDGTYGCTELRDVNDEGETLAGKVLLLERRGGCIFQDKVDSASAKNVAALIVYDSCSEDCGGELQRIEAESYIPTYFMQGEDGYLLRNAILARRAFLNGTAPGIEPVKVGMNYSAPIIGTFAGTGPLASDELAVLQTIVQTLTLHSVYDATWQREWTDLIDHPELDPCGVGTTRIAGVWCERSRITSVYLKYTGLDGVIDPAWAQLTKLVDLSLSGSYPEFPGLSGSIPDTFCTFPSLRSLAVDNNVLTSWPDCFGSGEMSKSIVYLQFDNNRFTTLPTSLGSATSLIYLVGSSNKFTELPTSLQTLTQLYILDLSLCSFEGPISSLDFSHGFHQLNELRLNDNQLSGSLPDTFLNGIPNLSILELSRNQLEGSLPSELFANGNSLTQVLLGGNHFTGSIPTSLQVHTSLNVIDLSECTFEGILPSTVFDGMTTLEKVLLQGNSFTGSPPDFRDCTSLVSVNLEHNQFTTGPSSSTWSSLPIQIIKLSYNNLTTSTGLEVFGSMKSLKELYLDHNMLIADDVDQRNIGRFLYKLIGPALATLNLQNNHLHGSITVGFFPTWSRLHNLNLSTNFMDALPDDLFLATGLVHIDLSENTIVGTLPTDWASTPNLASFFIQGNSEVILPDFIKPSTNEVYESGREDLQECLGLQAPQFPNLQVKADPSALKYVNCRCKQGAYGTPPTCQRVPGELKIQPFDTNTTTVTSSSSSSRVVGGVLPRFASEFGPALYSPQPLGLSTSWVVDLTRLRKSKSTGIEQIVETSLTSTAIAAAVDLQPVRVLLLRIYISRAAFTLSTDVLSVIDTESGYYQEINGATYTDVTYPTALQQGITDFDVDTLEYRTFYNASLSTLVDPIRIDLAVPGNDATVSFHTAAAGTTPGFIATYTWFYTCPGSMRLLNADLGNQCLTALANQYVQGRNGSYTYECLALSTLSSVVQQSLTNPADIDYEGCRCSRSTFGQPPYCDLLPVQAIVTPHLAPVATGVKYALTVMATPELLDFNTSTANTSSSSIAPSSFTDLWYGDQRLMTGVSTAWSLDLRDLRLPLGGDRASGDEIRNQAQVDADTISGEDPLQPVRNIHILLHISQTYFTGDANTLSIASGSLQSTGERVFQISGSEVEQRCSNLQQIASSLDMTLITKLALTEAYQERYANALSQLDQPLICGASVQSNQAYVAFSSRDADSAHFVATYTYTFECSEGLELDGDNHCSTPGIPRSAALAVILSVCGVLLALSFGWVVRERYRRQKHQQRLARLSSASPSDEGEDEAADSGDLMKAEILRSHSNELKKELIGQAMSLVIELLLTILTWVNVGLLVTSEGGSLADSYLNVAYIAVSIVAFMGFSVNCVARGLSMYGLREEWTEISLQASRASVLKVESVSTDAVALQRLRRKITQLKIVSIAVLFDSAPVLLLNILRVNSVFTSEDKGVFFRYFFTCLFGSLLIGVKLTRLSNLPELKRQTLLLRLKIWEEKNMKALQGMSIGRRAGTISKIGNTGNGTAAQRETGAASVVTRPNLGSITPAIAMDPSALEENPAVRSMSMAHPQEVELQVRGGGGSGGGVHADGDFGETEHEAL